MLDREPGAGGASRSACGDWWPEDLDEAWLGLLAGGRRCSPLVMRAKAEVWRDHARLRSVTQVAEALGVSYHTLRARFRREARVSLEGFLSWVRVYHALIMLRDTNLLIKEIAWEVGFHYEEQLTRAMRKRLGSVPQVVRSRQQASRLVGGGLSLARRLA